MSEAPTLVLQNHALDDLPLSVLLFYTAMMQQQNLSDFANKIGIGGLSLHQFINGKTQRPRENTLILLAQALELDIDEVRRRNKLRPVSAPPFSQWLKERMGTFSRARLHRETNISDGALRNYLEGRTFPDPDQAYRLATTLHVEPLELAKVLVANHTMKVGGETVPPHEAYAPGYDAQPASGFENGYDGYDGYDEPDDDMDYVGGGTHAMGVTTDEERLLTLWRRLHPQGRRATLNYIAGLLVEM